MGLGEVMGGDWSVLVSRIALRGVSEWQVPFERAALIAALPDLADANPRVIDSTPRLRYASPNQSRIRVLDGDLSWETIVHMLEDPKDCRGMGAGIAVPRFGNEFDNPRQILQNALQQAIEKGEWDYVGYILEALFKSGVDFRESGQYALQQVIEKGRWYYLPGILGALSRSGVDIQEIGPYALQQAIKKGRYQYLPGILKVLSDGGVDIRESGADFRESGPYALQHTIKKGRYDYVSAILEVLSASGADIQEIGQYALQQAIKKGQRYNYHPGILGALSRSGVDIRESGLNALQQAIKKGQWYYVRDIPKVLADGGVDRAWFDRPGKSIASLLDDASKAAHGFDTVPPGPDKRKEIQRLHELGLTPEQIRQFLTGE